MGLVCLVFEHSDSDSRGQLIGMRLINRKQFIEGVCVRLLIKIKFQ